MHTRGDDDYDSADETLGCTMTIRTNDTQTEPVNVSEFDYDYKERVVRCRQSIQHRVNVCAPMISKVATTTLDLGVALGASVAGLYVGPHAGSCDLWHYTER